MLDAFNHLNFVNLIFLIPIVAIIGGIGSEIIGKLLKHRERLAEIKAKVQTRSSTNVVPASNDALREELALLRDTCTKYDMSLQHALEEVQHRLEFLEARSGLASKTGERQSSQTPEVLRVSSGDMR